jgi:hypothetical protein
MNHKEYMREWRKNHKDDVRKTNRKYYETHLEEWRKYRNRYILSHGEQIKERIKISHQNLKFSVLAIYSEGQPECSCCGETEISFLSIDHINNDGADHRRKFARKYCTFRGYQFYLWLRKYGFPEGFQVLCMNCQFGKKHNAGICPHK